MSTHILTAIIVVSICSAVVAGCVVTGSALPLFALLVIDDCLPSNYEDK
jgi:hypothetical protein